MVVTPDGGFPYEAAYASVDVAASYLAITWNQILLKFIALLSGEIKISHYLSRNRIYTNGYIEGLSVDVVARDAVYWRVNIMLVSSYDGAMTDLLYGVPSHQTMSVLETCCMTYIGLRLGVIFPFDRRFLPRLLYAFMFGNSVNWNITDRSV